MLRTLLVILTPLPELFRLFSEVMPPGYSIHIVNTRDECNQFIAALVTPRRVGYYYNAGVATADMAAFYMQRKKRENQSPDLTFHEEAVPALFSCLSGSRAIFLSPDGRSQIFRVNRFCYDACIFQLPERWEPEFLTNFSHEHKVPSNIPPSPDGDYFFAYLITRIKAGKMLSKYHAKFFEAWFVNQHQTQMEQLVEEVEEAGQSLPLACIVYMKLEYSEKMTRYNPPPALRFIVDKYIEAGVFCADWVDFMKFRYIPLAPVEPEKA